MKYMISLAGIAMAFGLATFGVIGFFIIAKSFISTMEEKKEQKNQTEDNKKMSKEER